MAQVVSRPANALSAVDYFKAKLQFEISPHGLYKILNKGSVLPLDVRDEKSYAREHIRGAINVPIEKLPGRLRDLPREKTIVAYGWAAAWRPAAKAALELAQKEYKVQELIGGIEGWREAGLPLEGKETAAPDTRTAPRRQEENWENEGGRPR